MGLLTYMRRSIPKFKIRRKKNSQKHAGTTAVCLRISFQARIRSFLGLGGLGLGLGLVLAKIAFLWFSKCSPTTHLYVS